LFYNHPFLCRALYKRKVLLDQLNNSQLLEKELI